MIQTESESGNLKMALPPDKYGLLVYNSGDHHTQLKRNQFDQIEGFYSTNEIDGRMDMPVAPVYGLIFPELIIEPKQDVTLKIAPILFTKSVIFRVNIKNGDRSSIKGCSAILEGVTSTIYGTDKNIENLIDVPFQMQKFSSGYEGMIYVLDEVYEVKQPETPLSNRLRLDFLLDDGRYVTSSCDMKSLLRDIKEKELVFEIGVSLDKTSEPTVILDCVP